ncbi:Nn.00g117750.m01.CDS01 [Neocucurbitaria sp. VM-36]
MRTRTATRQPKPSIETPMRGDAQTLFKMSSAAKRDIQGFIAGQYKAVDRMGHELTNPTGTKFIFNLSLSDHEEAFVLSLDAKAVLVNFIHEKHESEPIALASCPPLKYPASTQSQEPMHNCIEDYMKTYIQHGTTALSTIEEVDEDDTSILPPIPTFEKSSTLDSDRKARLMRSHNTPSLAQIIASADPRDFPFPDKDESESGSDSDSEHSDDLDSTIRKIEKRLAYLAELNEDDDLDAKSNDYSKSASLKEIVEQQEQGHCTSPPGTLVGSAAYPRTTNVHKTLIKRHDNKVPLAHLISLANADDTHVLDSDSYHSDIPPSPQTTLYSFALKPCLDPHFPGHTPCHAHEQRAFGRSAEDAVEVLRERFEIAHFEMGHRGSYRAWSGAKGVRGGSGLRREVVCDQIPFEAPPDQVTRGNELLEYSDSAFGDGVTVYLDKTRQTEIACVGCARIKLFDNVLREHDNEGLPSQHQNTGTIVFNARKPVLDDEDSADLSVRTPTFSNRTSITSKSSHESVRLASARLIDALDLEIDAHKCQDGCSVCMTTLRDFSVTTIARPNTSADNIAVTGNDRKRFVSSPVVPSVWVDHALDEPAAVLSAVRESPAHRSPARLQRMLEVPDMPDRIGQKSDDFLTYLSPQNGQVESDGSVEPLMPLPVDLSSALVRYHPVAAARIAIPALSESEVAAGPADTQEHTMFFDGIRDDSRSRRWVSKMKSNLRKVPEKAHRTTHRGFEATKKFALTIRQFVPAALAACM